MFASPFEAWFLVIMADLAEMPDEMRFSIEDAKRWWEIDDTLLLKVLDALIAAGRLRRDPDGYYAPQGHR